MTATLTFNLPEEYTDLSWAIGAPEMAGTIVEIMGELRSWQKHGHKFTTIDEAINAVREIISEAHRIASATP
jgi:hypothetical protein